MELWGFDGDREDLKNRRIGVLMGGRSSEREISLKSGQAVLASLVRSGYAAVGIDAGQDLPDLLKKERVDIAFIALHGRWGEDGTVQGLLDDGDPLYGLRRARLGPRDGQAPREAPPDEPGDPYPGIQDMPDGKGGRFQAALVVKPASEGSTVGISIVRKPEETKGAIRPPSATTASSSWNAT